MEEKKKETEVSFLKQNNQDNRSQEKVTNSEVTKQVVEKKDTADKQEKFHWTWKNLFFSFLWLAPILILIDQLSKWAVVNALNAKAGASIEVIPHFFYLTLTFNQGSSFGMGANVSWMRFIFIAISWLASGAIAWYWIKNLKRHDTWIDVILSLCLSGALGNAIDRTFYWEGTVGFSGVIDFFQFYIFGYNNDSFAIFNVADSLLIIGIVLLMIVMVVREVKKRK